MTYDLAVWEGSPPPSDAAAGLVHTLWLSVTIVTDGVTIEPSVAVGHLELGRRGPLQGPLRRPAGRT